MHVNTLPSATPHTTSTNGDGIMATRGGGRVVGGILNGSGMAK